MSTFEERNHDRDIGYVPESTRDNCENCGGQGWLLTSIDGHEAPTNTAYLQKCDMCDYYKTDFWAALGYQKEGLGSCLAVLVRHECL